jgi:hypothetical protein
VAANALGDAELQHDRDHSSSQGRGLPQHADDGLEQAGLDSSSGGADHARSGPALSNRGQRDISAPLDFVSLCASLIIQPIPFAQASRIREAEAMLAWGGANLLDDRPWKRLPNILLLSLTRMLDLPPLWDGNGVPPACMVEAVIDKFTKYSKASESRSLLALARGPDATLSLELIRDTDAVQFYQLKRPFVDLTGPDPRPCLSDKESALLGASTTARVLTHEEISRARDLLWLVDRPVVIPTRGALPETETAGERLVRQARTVLERALEEVVGGGAPRSPRGSAHRKTRSRRRSYDDRDGDSGSDSDGDNPDHKVRRACRALRDSLGGLAAMTDATRRSLPVLSIPADRITADMLQLYLSPARFRAVYLWGSKSATEVTKLLRERRKAAKLEDTARASSPTFMDRNGRTSARSVTT